MRKLMLAAMAAVMLTGCSPYLLVEGGVLAGVILYGATQEERQQ